MEARGPEELLAEEVRAWRNRRDLTAQQLADRVTAHGGRLTQQAISKIENGGRGVSISELIQLGRALNVPPLALIFPVGHVPTVEVLPGKEARTWDSAAWFAGEDHFPGAFTADGDHLDRIEWYSGAAAIELHREMAALIEKWGWTKLDEKRERDRLADADDVERNAILRGVLDLTIEAERLEAELGRTRESARRAGVDPGELDPDLAHVDAQTGRGQAGRGPTAKR